MAEMVKPLLTFGWIPTSKLRTDDKEIEVHAPAPPAPKPAEEAIGCFGLESRFLGSCTL